MAVEDIMLPEGGRDDSRTLEAIVDIAPGLEVDVLNLLAVDLLADEVEETVLVVDIDGEVGETRLRDDVHDRQFAGRTCIVEILEQARDGDLANTGEGATNVVAEEAATNLPDIALMLGEQVVGNSLLRLRASDIRVLHEHCNTDDVGSVDRLDTGRPPVLALDAHAANPRTGKISYDREEVGLAAARADPVDERGDDVAGAIEEVDLDLGVVYRAQVHDLNTRVPTLVFGVDQRTVRQPSRPWSEWLRLRSRRPFPSRS